MSQEQPGTAPEAQQLVEIVGGRRARLGLDPLAVVDIMQQPEIRVVDQFVFLPFPQGFDRQTELLLDLVHRLVVQIGDPAVHMQHRLGHAQLVFPW